MKSNKNYSQESLGIALLIVAIVGIAFATSTNILNNNQLEAQQLQQQTQTSSPHNAKGHESHQAVHLLNSSQGVVYKGTVTFNSSKAVDIIAYEDVTGQQNTSATANVWDVNGNKYAPKTLMKNVTEGTVNFEGAGILTHSTSSQPYTVTFTINAAPVKQ